MAELGLAARSAFTELKTSVHTAFAVEVREDLTLATLAPFKSKVAIVRDAMWVAYGIELPSAPERIEGNGIAVLWNGPDQWVVMAERVAAHRDLERELKTLLAGDAAITDLSDGRAIVRVSGARVRDVLAKGLPIDLHPRAFRSGSVAITHAAHIGVTVWQLDAKPTYEIAVARSFADSFANWLTHSAAEFVGP